MKLGPFVLDRVLGQGGMGAVWRAVHESQGVPVAVKIDLHPPAPESTAAFLHEVQIVAALDHRNVVMVLDHGVVDDAVQRASGGEIRTGARWLAMELAGAGTAADRPPRTWEEVRHLTRGLLDGLGHAHARGVIHRDIKPANALLAGDEASVASVPADFLSSRIVLSDFGISERRDHTALRTEDSVGTPHYMAPEQIEARFRDQGPWTDLYALGVLIWRLVAGDYPFKGQNAFQIYKKHLYDRPPQLRPVMPVPAGLEELLRTLLAKAPADRPAFAAEARRAIDALGEPEDLDHEPPPPAADDDEENATVTQAPMVTGRSYAGRSRTRGGSVPLLHEGRRANVQLHGAGLALFGLRTVPFVGRQAECDRLWNALVAVRADKSARAVLVRGPSGIGKTRLVDWVSHKAHELGIATTLRAVPTAGAPPGEAIVRMLARELGTDGLESEELDQRLLDRFPESRFDRHALARLLGPRVELPPPSGAEARQLALAVLSEIARDRPTVVIIEDAHLDVEALELLDALLTLQALSPRELLVLATVRDEDLVDHADAEALIEELVEDPAVDDLALGPLDEAGRQALVRNLLGLEGALARLVEERTAGNPLFANQVLGSWVERGVLVPGPSGFRVAEGRSPTIPSSLGEAWVTRLDLALAGRPSAEVEALELAAALGTQVDDDVWTSTCALLQLDPSERLIDLLLRRHLIHAEDPERRAWRFNHGLLRDALVRQSRAAGHWADHNLAAAVHLRERGGVRPIRLARHLLEAEVWDEAVEPLFLAVDDQIDSGDLRSADLIDQLEGVLDLLGVRAPDPERVRLEVLKANRHRARGELEEAERHAEDAVADASAGSEGDVGPRALREAARILFARASFDRALARATEAEEGFLALGDRVRAADCAYTVGEILSATGRLDEAEAKMVACRDVFRTQGGMEFLYLPLVGLAFIAWRRGDLEQTLARVAECRAHCEPLGLQWALATCANLEGEAARGAGDEALATTCYREAMERYKALESPDFAYPLLNLCILDLQRMNFAESLARLRQLRVYLDRNPKPELAAYADMVEMVARAGLGERSEGTAALGRLATHVSTTGLVDPDVAALSEQAAVLMQNHGWTNDARRAVLLAESQYRSCGRAEDADRARAMADVLRNAR